MKNKLIFLTKNSLKDKLKSKCFLIVNILLLILIIGVFNIDSIIKLFGGKYEEKQKIYIVDNTNYTYDLIEKNLKSNEITDNDTFDIEKLNNENKEKIKKDEIIIVVNEDKENLINVNIISKGYIDIVNYQVIVNAINNAKINLAINNSDININLLNNIYK